MQNESDSKNLVYITRREVFCAAHRLYNPLWDEEKNQEIFGLCSSPNYHGHNYQLFVTVKGYHSIDTGFVFNAKELSTIIKKVIIDRVDHKNLNVDVDFMKNQFTSVENVCVMFWNELYPHIQKRNVMLHKIMVKETENIEAEYLGEK